MSWLQWAKRLHIPGNLEVPMHAQGCSYVQVRLEGPYLSPLLAEETTEGLVESICKGQFQLYNLQSLVQKENAELLIKILKSISTWQQHNIKLSIEPF